MKLFVGTKAVIHYEGMILLIRESAEYADREEMEYFMMEGCIS